MIKLENISTLDITGFGTNTRSEDISRRNVKVIQEFKLEDYEQLKNYLLQQKMLAKQGKQTNICFSDGLEKRIKQTEEKINVQDWSVKPHIYEPEDIISLSEIGDRNVIDNNTPGRVLLYAPPVRDFYHKDKLNGQIAKSINIHQIRQLLSHCNTNGINSYLSYVFDDADINMHKNEVVLILNALKQYDLQLLRQYEENKATLKPEDLPNLMFLNKDNKLKLIRKQYLEIADYLEKFDYFVWGADSKGYDKDLIWNSAHKHDLKNVHIRNEFMNIISDYVTLEEAEKGLVKTKAIDRFGVKTK